MSVNSGIDAQAISDGIDQLTSGVEDLTGTQTQPLPTHSSGSDLVGSAVDGVGSELLDGVIDIAGDVVGAVIGAAGDLIAGIFD